MHIDDLIETIQPYIPFNSKQAAQEFIDRFEESDRIALISAMYIGRSHIHSNKIDDDHIKYLRSGEMDRYWAVFFKVVVAKIMLRPSPFPALVYPG